jgi:glycosyltransferase involved in cell wall biosynthesis
MSLKFSIITCTWNSARYLSKSISSVLSQKYANIEYIFVDGGSDDGTIDLIHEIPRHVKFVTGIKGGISSAMNKGIELATGDVVAHLHSDDYYLHGNVLSCVAQVLTESGTEWCFGRAMDDIGEEVKPEPWQVPVYSYRRLLKGNFIPHPATFVRKRVFDQLGMYDTGCRYAMDYDMWLRIGRVYQPVQVDKHWSVFRRHEGSLSNANKMESFAEDFKIRMRHVTHTPWDYAYHYIYYFYRQHRLRRQLQQMKS